MKDYTKSPNWMSIKPEKQEELIQLYTVYRDGNAGEYRGIGSEALMRAIHEVLGQKPDRGMATESIDQISKIAGGIAEGSVFEILKEYSIKFNTILLATSMSLEKQEKEVSKEIISR